MSPATMTRDHIHRSHVSYEPSLHHGEPAPARIRSESATFDGQQPQFRVDSGPRVMELLRALPFVKMDSARQQYMMVSPFSMPAPHIEIARPGGDSPPVEPIFYTGDIPSPPGIPEQAFDVFPEWVNFARLGLRVRALEADARSVPSTSAQNLQSRIDATTEAYMRRVLDSAIARGPDGIPSSPLEHAFQGLEQLAHISPGGTRANVSEAIADCVAEVACNGPDGAGEGPDCIIVSPLGFKALVRHWAHGFGTGWFHCPRVGRRVFHYNGLPVYRTDIDGSTPGATSKAYAANLGPWGVQLLHTESDRAHDGITWTPPERDLATGQWSKLCYGSFALVRWELHALVGCEFNL